MEFKDASDTTLKLIDKIDNLWSLFFASNLGLAIWIFSEENEISVILTAIVTLAYIAYSTVQFFALIRGYKFLELAITELKLSVDSNGIKSEELKSGIKKLKYKGRITIVVISYLVALTIVLFLLWTDCKF